MKLELPPTEEYLCLLGHHMPSHILPIEPTRNSLIEGRRPCDRAQADDAARQWCRASPRCGGFLTVKARPLLVEIHEMDIETSRIPCGFGWSFITVILWQALLEITLSCDPKSCSGASKTSWEARYVPMTSCPSRFLKHCIFSLRLPFPWIDLSQRAGLIRGTQQKP